MTVTTSCLQHQSVSSHEAYTRLVKLDMGPTGHYEICTGAQIDHNAYGYSQYVTLTHGASADFKKFGDVTPYGLIRAQAHLPHRKPCPYAHCGRATFI